MSAHHIPGRNDLSGEEILVEIYDPRPDSMNRVHFYAYWHDAKTPAEGGPPDGVRGQVYHCDLAEFTADTERRGKTVRHWAPEASP